MSLAIAEKRWKRHPNDRRKEINSEESQKQPLDTTVVINGLCFEEEIVGKQG